VTPTALQHAPYYAVVALAAGGAGVLLAWWLRRHTSVSIRNVYLAAATVIAVDVLALYSRAAIVLPAIVPLTSCTVVAAAVGRRWRLSDLGAGEELRTHEQHRRPHSLSTAFAQSVDNCPRNSAYASRASG